MAIHSAADLRISARLTSLLGSVSRNICAEKQQEVLGRASAQAHQTVSRCRKSRSGDIQRSHLAKATKIEDLAAAHQQDSSISPPAALLCIPTTADSIDGVLKEIEEVRAAGAGVIELRLDYLKDLDLEDPEAQIQALLGASRQAELPAIITLRPGWEGGKYNGSEPVRLAVLKLAATLQPAYIDVEFLAADFFFSGAGTVPIGTNVILSHHDYDQTPTDEALDALVAQMVEGGADIAKIATTAKDVSDSLRMLQLAQRSEVPVIALAMGERGVPSRLLASKFGSHLTFGCLGAGRGTAPGQFSMQDLLLYRVGGQCSKTQVYGVVGNPVAHSRSPALHNAALASAGIDAVYIPYLVDDLQSFLKSFEQSDFRGFSVTLPHKIAAFEAADEVDPVARKIGAVNTLVRAADGTLKGYNTDTAAIDAIEAALSTASDPECDPEGCSLDFDDIPVESSSVNGDGPDSASPLKGLRVVIVGAGGSARALAFAAADRGAKVILANRTRQRAEDLCEALGQGSEVADLDDVQSGAVSGNVLINTTTIGMQPDIQNTPVPKSALEGYQLVFDAVYTPMDTTLLKDAKGIGKVTVSGLEMFVGQAAQQFELFTGESAPMDTMREAVLKSLQG